MQNPTHQRGGRRDYQPDATGPTLNHTLPLGELLVRQKALTRQQVDHLLDVQAAVGRPFGDLAERLFGVPQPAVESAWAEQFIALHGEADVAEVPVESAVVSLLEPRQAWQFQVVPLRVELAEATRPGHLLVAITRRRMRRSMTFASRTFRLPPSFVIATADSVARQLERHYPIGNAAANWAKGR